MYTYVYTYTHSSNSSNHNKHDKNDDSSDTDTCAVSRTEVPDGVALGGAPTAAAEAIGKARGRLLVGIFRCPLFRGPLFVSSFSLI